jgi:predicted metal-binding protein
MGNRYETLIEKAVELGATDARLIETNRIVFDPRSYLKCRFGCNRWGKYWTCPPHLEITPEQFMNAFSRYSVGLVIKAADPAVGQKVTLAMEKEAMMAHGCMYAFAMVLCVQCEECACPDPCRYPHLARPSMDAYGIDIGKTVEVLDFQVAFDPTGQLLPAWYSIVLLD